MIILGIHDGHNSSAALMIDGKIVAAMSEERFTYRKNETGFPEHAVKECLRIGGLEGKDVDEAGFTFFSMPIQYMRSKRECLFTIRDWLDEQEYYWKAKLFENRTNVGYLQGLLKEKRLNEPQVYNFDGLPLELSREQGNALFDRLRKEALSKRFGVDPAKVKGYDHHTCHAYYAYFASPFRDKDAVIFTADGGGDDANASVSVVKNDRVTELARNNVTDLGRIYRYITLILGMRIGEHEYKVMGLAPYASEYEKRKCDKVFKGIFHVPDMLVEYKNRPKDLFFHFRDSLADCRFDGIAGGVQEMLEDVGGEWFRKVTTKLGISRVVFSGGLSMNVKLNKIVSELDSVKEFYCPASGGDESLAIGVCYLMHKKRMDSPALSFENNYMGPQDSRENILKAVSGLKGYTVLQGVADRQVAALLENNVVIGRFAGRMEFGARALGNRSILANPSNPAVVKKINQQIKFRDFWMPFAPSVLDRYADKYLINPKGLLNDHMTTCFDTTELGKKVLIAALHPTDYTVRAHIVRKDLNPGYYALLEEFARRTGIGAVLNTSFNLHGYPIVCSAEQALHVFENSELDAMILEDILVARKNIDVSYI